MAVDEWLAQRIRLYAERYDVRIGSALGSGHHGNVFVAESNANRGPFALKFCKDYGPYAREVRAYETLAENEIFQIEGFSVPSFLGCDEQLLAVAMSIVEPPFLLDFAGAYDEFTVPEFSENIWSEWREQRNEEFGTRWQIVENVLSALRRYDIYMIDIHPRNIVFRESST